LKYLALIYGDESVWDSFSEEESAAVYERYGAFGDEGRAAGVVLGGAELASTHDATTVRVRDGETLVTDGPYAETKEQLGGFYLLECKDLDEAIEWAAKIPGAKVGTIEVRPVLDYEAVGSKQQEAAAAQS
jgi:hypothetical protein